jgi:type I restriction enzyme S subunit
MNDWPKVRLGEVLTERRETPLPDDLDSGRVQIIEKIRFSTGQIQLRSSGSTKTGMILIRPGDFVVSGINAAKGAVAIYDDTEQEPVAATIHYGAYIPNHDRVDARFLWWMLRSRFFQGLLLEYVPGGIKTELKAKRLLPIPVPLPPLAEQQRIVAQIEGLTAQINEAHTLRQQAVEEADALLSAEMHHVFDFKDASTTKVGNYARVQGGYAFSSGAYVEQGSHQVVRIGNVRDGYLDLSRAPVRWNPHGDERVLRYELKPGDIIISMTGTREKRDYGYVAKVPEGVHLLLNQRVGRFILQREIDKNYLFQFLRSPFFRDRLFPSATGTANQANVGNDDIEKITFVPPLISDQHRIVAELDALQAEVDSLKRMQAETAAELDALLPAILDRAFKGEL